MNHTKDQQIAIDLKSNPIVSRFFEGWNSHKAIDFGQNLLLIGIGVAYKLLINNSPEEAFTKLNKMAYLQILCFFKKKLVFFMPASFVLFFQADTKDKILQKNILTILKQLQIENVTIEYYNYNKYGHSPNRYQNENPLKNQQISQQRKKMFENNQHQHQYDFKKSNEQDDTNKNKLQNEINSVKYQLDILNNKLDQQQVPSYHQHYLSASPEYKANEEKRQQQQSNQRGRNNLNKQTQRVTPKITESPPPLQQMTIIRSMNSLSGPKPHLNDNGIKQCMQLYDQEDDVSNEGYQKNTRRTDPQQYQSNQHYIPTRNQQFMRNSGINDNDFNSSKGMQSNKSPERSSNVYYSTESNFRKLQNENQRNNKDKSIMKNNTGSSPQHKNPSQQLVAFRDDRKKPYQNVESRIKEEVQAHRDQRLNSPNQQQQQYYNQNNVEGYKYRMNNGNNQQQNNMNLYDEQEMKGLNQGEEQINKHEDIVKEMGVCYSKNAQKKFYEKQEAEKRKQNQQKQNGNERNQFNHQQNQGQQQQYQMYPVQYIPQHQQQYQHNMGLAASSSPRQQNISQQGYPMNNSNKLYAYPQDQNPIGNDSNRMMANSYPDTFGEGHNASQKNTIYGGQQQNNNGDTNSFLSSPLMRQFNGDDYYNDEENQCDDTDQMNQREEIQESSDGFQFAQGSSMNATNQQQNILQSNTMRQSNINPYNNSLMMDPQRQLTGSRVGFNYSTQKKFLGNDKSFNNSDFAMPNEEVQQFLKNQQHFNLK